MYRAKDHEGKWRYGHLFEPTRAGIIYCGLDPLDLIVVYVDPTSFQRKLFFQDKSGVEVYEGMKAQTFYDDGRKGFMGVIVDNGVSGPGLKMEKFEFPFPLSFFPSFVVLDEQVELT